MTFTKPWAKGHAQESPLPQPASSHENSDHDEKAPHDLQTSLSSNEDVVNKEVQEGVQKAEAVTALWTTGSLVIAYLL